MTRRRRGNIIIVRPRIGPPGRILGRRGLALAHSRRLGRRIGWNTKILSRSASIITAPRWTALPGPTPGSPRPRQRRRWQRVRPAHSQRRLGQLRWRRQRLQRGRRRWLRWCPWPPLLRMTLEIGSSTTTPIPTGSITIARSSGERLGPIAGEIDSALCQISSKLAFLLFTPAARLAHSRNPCKQLRLQRCTGSQTRRSQIGSSTRTRRRAKSITTARLSVDRCGPIRTCQLRCRPKLLVDFRGRRS